MTLIHNLVKARRGTENEDGIESKGGNTQREGLLKGEVARGISLGREKTVKSGKACFIFVSLREIASIHRVPGAFFRFFLFFFFQFVRPGRGERSGYAGETFFPGFFKSGWKPRGGSHPDK